MSKKITREKFIWGLGFGALALGAGLAGSRALPPSLVGFHTEDVDGRADHSDAITRKSMNDFEGFTAWLDGARGYVGEVGIPSNDKFRKQFYPDQRKWKALGEVWYEHADSTRQWVTAHDVSELQIRGGYFASLYGSRGKRNSKGVYDRAISQPLFQSALVEAHPSFDNVLRGVNFSGGQAIDEATFSNENPGRFSSSSSGPVRKRDYWYPGIARDSVTGQNSFEYLHKRGVRLVRLGLRWERIQPTLGAPLETVEITRYKDSVEAAGAAGLQVVIDVHNYGVYYFSDGPQPLNSARLTGEHFKDLWQRLSYNFAGHQAVVAYDLMNEPFNKDGIVASFGQPAAQTWEDLTHAVVNKIRGQGDTTAIAVPVYAGMGEVPSIHPGGPWIRNDKNVLYTVHQYFDHYYGPGTGGGRYRQSYDQENTYYAENSLKW